MEKMIIITSDGEIKSQEYKGFGDVRDTVHGMAECILFKQEFPNPLKRNGKMYVDFYGNEEALLIKDDETLNKCNGMATLLYNGSYGDISDMHPIYGDIAVLVHLDTEEGCRGFEYLEEDVGGGEIEEAFCETWFAEDILMRIRNDAQGIIKAISERYTDNKPEPSFTMESFEDFFRE